jgi:glycolate oxidase iron-sulfur subunit
VLAVSECVHCGFCLPACPTYSVLGTEMDNPRGRLALMAALDEGRLQPERSLVQHLDLCLGCRACETACPSGVRYGERLEHAREALHGTSARPIAQRLLERAVLTLAAAQPALQRLGLGLLRGTGLARLAGGPLGARVLPAGLSLGGRLMCSASGPSALAGLTTAATTTDAASGPGSAIPGAAASRQRVGLLAGCIGRWLQPQVDAATVAVLRRAGCEVVAPSGQRCCGALHLHAGDRRGAQALARATIAAFETVGPLEAIVVNAAGCGAAMKGYGALLADDPQWSERAARFALRVHDAIEYLAAIGPPPMTRRIEARIACQDACHAAHVQKLGGVQARLLAAVPGLEVVPLDGTDRCCGSAGIYNLLHARVAGAILDVKLERWQRSGVRLVTAANTGCLMHIAAGAAARGVDVAAVHPIEILEAASR